MSLTPGRRGTVDADTLICSARRKRRASPISASRWQAQDRPDPVDRLQRLAALVGAGEATQLGVDGIQLRLQRRHHRQERVDLQASVLG